jgi:hypothetical protein
MLENTVAVAGGVGRTDAGAPEIVPTVVAGEAVPDVVEAAGLLADAFALEPAPQPAKYIDDANITPATMFRTTALLNRNSRGVLE